MLKFNGIIVVFILESCCSISREVVFDSVCDVTVTWCIVASTIMHWMMTTTTWQEASTTIKDR